VLDRSGRRLFGSVLIRCGDPGGDSRGTQMRYRCCGQIAVYRRAVPDLPEGRGHLAGDRRLIECGGVDVEQIGHMISSHRVTYCWCGYVPLRAHASEEAEGGAWPGR